MDWTLFDSIVGGAGLVCGLDEAGRGPLAGPVFAAAVILPHGESIPGLNDSKKLSEKKREELFDIICERALGFAIASVDNNVIDDINILNASLLAMRKAVEGLKNKPELLLVDGNQIRGFKEPAKAIVKGDSLIPSIAAASILAKVSRDRLCLEMDREYPEYGFAKHKGYGTKLHTEAILKNGPCPLHRRTFLVKLLGGR